MTLPAPAAAHVALVTGASGGIGAEIARELSRRGHELVLVARSQDKLDALAAELPTQVHVVAADLGDPAARERLVTGLEDQQLTVQILVNNAGFSTTGAVHAADPGPELALVELDVAAVVDLCSRLLPGMVRRGRGALLNVASTAAFQPLPGQAAYGGAKAFVLSYTRSITEELRGTGVTATALCPGPVDTGFGEAAGFSKKEADEALPKAMWVSAADVARAAVTGLDHGDGVVIPGLVNRVAAGLAQVTPKTLLARLVARSHPALKR